MAPGRASLRIRSHPPSVQGLAFLAPQPLQPCGLLATASRIFFPSTRNPPPLDVHPPRPYCQSTDPVQLPGRKKSSRKVPQAEDAGGGGVPLPPNGARADRRGDGARDALLIHVPAGQPVGRRGGLCAPSPPTYVFPRQPFLLGDKDFQNLIPRSGFYRIPHKGQIARATAPPLRRPPLQRSPPT